VSRAVVTAPTEADWAVVRAVRLAALADSPDAFEAVLAEEETRTEEEWRARVRAGGFRLAWLDGEPVGLARGERHRDEHHLVGVWISPAARGRGAAPALVDAVVGWAREQGASRLYLWVIGDNPAAHALYRRHGFLPTGRVQPLPVRPEQTEQQYALPLDRPPTRPPGDS